MIRNNDISVIPSASYFDSYYLSLNYTTASLVISFGCGVILTNHACIAIKTLIRNGVSTRVLDLIVVILCALLEIGSD